MLSGGESGVSGSEKFLKVWSQETGDLKKENTGGSAGKAVASDFDNTLYFMGDEEPMRASDIFGILYFQQRGGLFGICTGRSLIGVTEVIGPYIRPDFFILASGALVVDGNGQILHKKCLPLDIVKSIYDRFSDSLRVVIQANDTVYTFGSKSYLQSKISSFEELEGADVYGVSMAAPDPETAAAAAEKINELYGKDVTAFQNVTHVDVAPAGCSKGSGIEVVRKAFGVRQMYGVGDSFNDIPFLSSVDHPYSMAGSPDEVTRISEGTVRSVSELLERI